MPAVQRAVLAVVIPALALVACRSDVRHPVYLPQMPGSLVEVTSPPPPARVEIVPEEPQSSSGKPVWVDGEWTWRRGRWAWIPGKWLVAPAGAFFAPWAFVRGADGRLWYAPGVWRTLLGVPLDPPAALSIASVETGAVVTADGATEITGPTVRVRPHPTASSSATPPAPSSPPARPLGSGP